ncbi:MAG TPA: GNAT family N-acetyltransferase [Planctomycetota bacterium]|nr:GNAT family N-acetyltransferase [Planctomycetota bacterium]
MDDAEAMAAVVRAAFEEHAGRLDPPSGAHAETAESLQAKLATGRATVAILDDAIVGCVFEIPRGDHLYVSRLAVLPEVRHRKIGAALMHRAEEQARALGLSRVELGVRIALPRLRAWYEGLGYRWVRSNAHAGFPRPTYDTLAKELGSRPSGA